jgi:hypothetical protein
VLERKSVTPNAIKKLVAKAWCARQIMWSNKKNGILLEVGADGYYLTAPKRCVFSFLARPVTITTGVSLSALNTSRQKSAERTHDGIVPAGWKLRLIRIKVASISDDRPV